MLTVALAVLAAALVAGGSGLPLPPLAVARVPDEPGAIVLDDGVPTLQAITLDVDGDGARDVVRLVRLTGRFEGRVRVEVWTERASGWTRMTRSEQVIPSGDADLRYVGSPVRLVVRRVDGEERVTLVRQPAAISPGDRAECCLLLDDIDVRGNRIRMTRVASRAAIADAVHAIDLDGDGTDELLATRSEEPLDVPTTPVEARVFRWADGRFEAPVSSDLPVGTPSSAYILGDSDGVPGDEVGFISRSANYHLFRSTLGPGDRLITEDSGVVVSDALAVPLGDGQRGIALLNPTFGVAAGPWPRGARPGPGPTVPTPVSARLVGVISLGGQDRLLVRRVDPPSLSVLSLPELVALDDGPIQPSAASLAAAAAGFEPFAGLLPGGGPTGAPTAIVAGRLMPSPFFADRTAAFAALPNSAPIGLVGRARDSIAILQGVPRIDSTGGPLDPPIVPSRTAVTIAPFVEAGTAEGNGGSYEPAMTGSVTLDSGAVGITDDGVSLTVDAPAGSRVYQSLPDDVRREPLVVDSSGPLTVAIEPPPGMSAAEPASVAVVVATPAGHAYVRTLDLQLVDSAPDLSAEPATPLGSTLVTIAGRTAAYAQVEVDGIPVEIDDDGRFSTSVDLPPWPTEVVVTARDPFGHEARVVATGVGLFDYRGLPWTAIALVLLAALAVALVLRVPKARVAPRPVSDDGALEELDPADRL